MDFFFLQGLILVLLIQLYGTEDLSSFNLASTTLIPHDEVTQPKPRELSPGEAVPGVVPPSLKEVEKAVQEASEQAEGRAAEEVLKELLERVVEAALGEAGGAAAEEALGEQAIDAEEGDAGHKAETEGGVGGVEQALEEAAVVEGPGALKAGLGGEEKQEVTGVSKVVAEAAEGETTEGEGDGMVDVGGAEEEGGVVDTSPTGSRNHPTIRVEPADVLEDFEEQVLSEERGIARGGGGVLELTTEEEEEQGADIERGEMGEASNTMEEKPVGETVKSSAGLGGGDVEQLGDVGGKEEVEMQGGAVVDGVLVVAQPPTGDSGGLETPQSVLGQDIEEQEQEVTAENERDGQQEEVPGGLGVNGAAAVEVVEAGDGEVGEGAWGDGTDGGPLEEDLDALVNGEVKEANAASEEDLTMESPHGSQAEGHGVLVVSPPESEHGAGEKTSVDQEPETLPGPTLAGGRKTTGIEEPPPEQTNHNNEIPSSDELLSHDPALAKPAADHLVEQVPATPPLSEEAEPGQANELVEDSAGTSDMSLLGLDAWKTGAIAAAVILVLETLVIVIYILKCRNGAKSAPAPRACEEGRLEPEATTAGECSDDTLTASNGDTQLIAALDPSAAALALGQDKGKQQEEQEIAMSDLPPGSTEQTAGPESDRTSSPDVRTSIL